MKIRFVNYRTELRLDVDFEKKEYSLPSYLYSHLFDYEKVIQVKANMDIENMIEVLEKNNFKKIEYDVIKLN